MATAFVSGADLILGGDGINIEGEGGNRSFSRAKIADAIEVLVALLDASEPDTDNEPDTDLEENPAEDAFVEHQSSGPGCPIADPDAAVDDSPCDEPFQDLEPEAGL
jgi:hypothetical protein